MDLFDIFFFGGEGSQPAPTPVLIEKSITENGTYNAEDDSADGYSQVTVNVSDPVEEKAVNFYDYDGTLLYGYSFDEVAELSELPALPSHTGLTAQGWTHTLAQVQAEGTAERALDVGATHTTSDGSTQLYLFVSAGAKLPNIQIHVYMDANSSATVDWGDGTTGSLVNSSGSAANVYAEKTDWQIVNVDTVFCIRIIGGSFVLGKSGVSNNAIFNVNTPPVLLKAYLGGNCRGIDSNAFNRCYSLTSVVIPQGVTNISNNAFNNCYSLTSVVIPQGVTNISNNVFNNCYSLTSVVIPQGVTSIGNSVFNNCYSLTSVVIPQGVTSIGNNNAFYNCYSLTSVVIPQGVTSISNYAFNNCYSLTSVVIPQGVTSIGNSVFYNCYSLTSVVIPQGVTNISNYAFTNCANLYSIDLTAFTSANQIPTLSSLTAIPSTVSVLWVHDSSMITAFEAATNWSSFAGKYVVKGA